MTEPVTSNRSLVVPNTGDLVAAWGTAALNPNFGMIDGMFGGLTTISLSVATTITLSVPPPNGNWTSGTLAVAQSVNALIRLTGAQTGSATLIMTLPGFYIIENQCTGTTSVRLQPSNLTGNCVGAPPGKKQHVFFDGVHLDFINMPDPGTAYDFHTNTTTLPPWQTACTVAPYLLKDGTVYNIATYPALGQYLGSTYGGNGATTFGVPDERSRMRIPVATGSDPSRVTNAISAINGTTFGSAGGSQSMQSHRHINTVTDPGHTHTYQAASYAAVTGGGAFSAAIANTSTNSGSSTTGITLNNVTTGAGGSQNMPPAIVSFLALIKT